LRVNRHRRILRRTASQSPGGWEAGLDKQYPCPGRRSRPSDMLCTRRKGSWPWRF
jgi:hypothetical protein